MELTPRYGLVMSLVTARTWCSHGKLCPGAFSIGTKLKTRLVEHCFTLITVGSIKTREMEARTRQICRTNDWCANWDALESIAHHWSALHLLVDLGHQWNAELKNGEEIASFFFSDKKFLERVGRELCLLVACDISEQISPCQMPLGLLLLSQHPANQDWQQRQPGRKSHG